MTIWADPGGAGQKLLGRSVQAAGITRPADLPFLAPEDDFPRTAEGFAGLLAAAGLAEPSCQTVKWEHRVAPDDWWDGAASGVSFFGHLVVRQAPEKIAEIKRHFDLFSSEFGGRTGCWRCPMSRWWRAGAPDGDECRTDGAAATWWLRYQQVQSAAALATG